MLVTLACHSQVIAGCAKHAATKRCGFTQHASACHCQAGASGGGAFFAHCELCAAPQACQSKPCCRLPWALKCSNQRRVQAMPCPSQSSGLAHIPPTCAAPPPLRCAIKPTGKEDAPCAAAAAASKTNTCQPCCASAYAALAPAKPAPMISARLALFAIFSIILIAAQADLTA